VHFKVIEGFFKDAEGDVIFLDSQSHGTQAECLARYGKEVSFNETIFQVTIEAVMKYVAEIMRTHIEQR
jgi:ABC-type branched-subunit amino acid transport system ATPase component